MDRIGFQQFFQALPSPHMLLDRDLNFVAVNRAYELATEQTSSSLVGRYLFEAFPNEGDAGRRLRESLDRVLKSGEPDTLAYIEYDIPVPTSKGGGMTKRYWTAIHAPLTDDNGQVVYILQNTVDITELVQLREAASAPSTLFSGGIALVQRAREAEKVIRDGVGPTQQFRALFEDAPGMVALLYGPDHVVTYANASMTRFFGQRELLGLSIRKALPELECEEPSGLLGRLDKTYHTGEAAVGFATSIRLRDQGSDRLREYFVDLSHHPVASPTGQVSGIFLQGYDRTEAVRGQRHQKFLLDELNHRVKNTLSTVQSWARRSFRATIDREDARRVFEGRILALSNAHNLLSEQRWEAAELGAIARLEFAALPRQRVETEGGRFDLSPKAAIALAMVFHELASNALKYGALAREDGHVSVRWEMRDQTLHLVWREDGSGLPETQDELKPGFGMRMLERIVTGELEGRLELALAPSSLTWTLALPASELETVKASEDE